MNTASAPVAPWMQETLREGFAHLTAGRLTEASECCRRLLSAKRDLVEGHFLVGLVALELKQTGRAIQAFGSVTTLKPDHAAAWANLARLFMQASDVIEVQQSSLGLRFYPEIFQHFVHQVSVQLGADTIINMAQTNLLEGQWF